MSFKAERITRKSQITLNGLMGEVFPLFGPIKESEWAPGWAPKIIYRTSLIEEHMVFTTTSHHGQEPDSTWTLSRYNPENAFIEYTVFAPERLWWITIQCRESVEKKQTEAEITYSYTGLTDRGNMINKKALDKMFEHNLKDWEEEINYYLDTGHRLEHKGDTRSGRGD